MKKETKKETDMLYDKLAVIIQTKGGKIYQVALNQEMADFLYSELRDYYPDGKIKILEDEIKGITLD